jgi:ABC-2 type transport system permease protein
VLLSHVSLARWDATKEKLNSLSDKSVQLINQLRKDDNVPPIKIDAYVSPQVPAEYAALKRNFISSLQELESLGGGKIQVDVNQIENFSKQATLAERTYGIEPREVDTNMGGSRKREEIYLGAAFTCGLDKVVIPFIDKGIPIEYELVRSIATVAQQERKKLGVLKTDVELFGGFSMQGQAAESRLVTELKKQYDVVEVDPTNPITERFDVMLAVQPSSLTPEKMDNFVAAVRAGQPIAVFEDPFPLPQFFPNVVGTGQPKRPPGGMMGMFNRQPPEPKGDINQLWKLLGVKFVADEIIWQDYNPYKRAQSFIDPQWIFVDEGNGAVQPFNPDNEISEGMRQVLFLIAGGWQPDNNSKLDFTALAVTGPQTGTINYMDFEMQMRGGPRSPRRVLTRESYIVAAEVSGAVETEDELFISATPGANEEEPEEEVREETESNIRAVLVADIDWIAPVIFMLREIGQEEEMLINWNFQNVAFVLNILDHLAEDKRFIDIRKRDRTHRILTKIEEATEDYREKSLQQTNDFVTEAREQIEAAGNEFQQKIDEIEARTDLDPTAKRQLLEITRQRLERIRDVKITRLEKDRDRKVRQSERDRDLAIRGVQSRYKTYAVLLPLIPPALVAFFVFFHRRKAEREGVSKSRLRYGGPIDERATESKP